MASKQRLGLPRGWCNGRPCARTSGARNIGGAQRSQCAGTGSRIARVAFTNARGAEEGCCGPRTSGPTPRRSSLSGRRLRRQGGERECEGTAVALLRLSPITRPPVGTGCPTKPLASCPRGGGNGERSLGKGLPSIAGGSIGIRYDHRPKGRGEPGTGARRNDERTRQDRHRRHVPGSAARGSPTQEGGAQQPAVGPGRWAGAPAEAKSLATAAGHRQVADEMWQRVDAAKPQTWELPERRRPERKNYDRPAPAASGGANLACEICTGLA
ncbi:MAG TPA: hypothetical protein VHE34_10555 [Puia sp.]|uniref:hypothetical protein n=1 Tax=Puia sp. TaxID=2045100 RepID=UPI002CE63943|nr:hypothetical protein [Puia sp.]HVU95657.1 hypothetical protein [Puia sp.]